ncbi:uncharacterized protein RJT20DRAFT_144270 [Scheffersomyces xylosifermentans]|uniref:uncharacterized protein n=1 Tax=Scheffersomyces xylosifermentans TaxID=1304137 RepID=UPI00315DC768
MNVVQPASFLNSNPPANSSSTHNNETNQPLSFVFSTQPHSLSQYNSEWIDSPNNSPSNKPRYLLNIDVPNTTADMSPSQIATSSSQGSKFETPFKPKAAFSYITPMTEHKTVDLTTTEEATEIAIQEKASVSSTPKPAPITKKVKSWDIFWAMLNDIVGKDKMAKVGQYTLRLLIFHAEKTQTYLSDDTFNIKAINKRYNSSEKQLNLIRNFFHHPSDFMKIIVILVCSVFRQRLAGMVGGLGMYRQFLRFGKTPFRIRDLANKVANNVSFKGSELQVNSTNLINRKTLGEIFSLYYGINDESLLLYKLNFLSNPTYKAFAARHESLGWYYETWLALYNAYENLQNLTQQEMDLKISIQVKSKAKLLSRQLLGNGSVPNPKFDFSSNRESSNEDAKILEDIQFKKNNAWIDIYKNISDLVFNTYTVFGIALPFDTIQIWMGISASTLSTIKLYRETKKKLLEKV